MLGANPASPVPTIILDSGLPLTESLLILLWLEKKVPDPPLLASDIDRVTSQGGRAMGVIDAMANIVTCTPQMDPNWGETQVGLKRRRTVMTGFQALDAGPPAYGGGVPDVTVTAAVVAVDYLAIRFADAPWRPAIPQLDALRDRVASRPAFASTTPHI